MPVPFHRGDALDLQLSQRHTAAGPGDHTRYLQDLFDLNAHFLQGPCNLLDITPLVIFYFGYKIHLLKDTNFLQRT